MLAAPMYSMGEESQYLKCADCKSTLKSNPENGKLYCPSCEWF